MQEMKTLTNILATAEEISSAALVAVRADRIDDAIMLSRVTMDIIATVTAHGGSFAEFSRHVQRRGVGAG